MKVDISESASTALAADFSRQTNQRSRRMLLAERTMYREGDVPFTTIFTIKLIGKLEEARLRLALARVQAKHPLLRCLVEETPSGPIFVLQDQPEPIRLRVVERHGEDDWQDEVYREWRRPFDAKHEPLVRFVWLNACEVNELLLIGHHCICDGLSGINLLRELMGVYDQPEKDLGTYEELGAVEDLVPAALLKEAGFQRKIKRREGLFRLGFFLKKLRRKSASLQNTPGQMYFHRWTMDHAALITLTERCSAEGVTVLPVISLAFMQAFRDVRGTHALNKAYAMVNARRFLPRLRSGAMFGLAPGVPLLMKDLPQPHDMSAGSFWSRARLIKADMTLRINRLNATIYSDLLALETMHDKYTSMVSATESAAAVRHITFSNIGRIDLPQQYRSFRLESVYSPLVMVSPTPANTVLLSSFAGQMEFAIVSDENSLASSHAMAINQRVMTILDAALKAPEQRKSRLTDQASEMRVKTI